MIGSSPARDTMRKINADNARQARLEARQAQGKPAVAADPRSARNGRAILKAAGVNPADIRSLASDPKPAAAPVERKRYNKPRGPTFAEMYSAQWRWQVANAVRPGTFTIPVRR